MPDNHEPELVEAPVGPAPHEAALAAPSGISLGSIAGGATSAHVGPAAAAGNIRPGQVIALQRSAGNQSVSRLIAPGLPGMGGLGPLAGLTAPEPGADIAE